MADTSQTKIIEFNELVSKLSSQEHVITVTIDGVRYLSFPEDLMTIKNVSQTA